VKFIIPKAKKEYSHTIDKCAIKYNKIQCKNNKGTAGSNHT